MLPLLALRTDAPTDNDDGAEARELVRPRQRHRRRRGGPRARPSDGRYLRDNHRLLAAMDDLDAAMRGEPVPTVEPTALDPMEYADARKRRVREVDEDEQRELERFRGELEARRIRRRLGMIWKSDAIMRLPPDVKGLLIKQLTKQETWADVCRTFAAFCATAKTTCEDAWPIIVHDLLEIPGSKPDDMSWNAFLSEWCKPLADPKNGVDYVHDEGDVVVSTWMLRHMSSVPDPDWDDDSDQPDDYEPQLSPVHWVSNASFLGNKEWAIALLPLQPLAFPYFTRSLRRDPDVAFLAVSLHGENWHTTTKTARRNGDLHRRILSVMEPDTATEVMTMIVRDTETSTDPQLRAVAELVRQNRDAFNRASWMADDRDGVVYGVGYPQHAQWVAGHEFGDRGLFLNPASTYFYPILFAVDRSGKRVE